MINVPQIFFFLKGLNCLFLTDAIPKWWIWGYWISPVTYGYNALAVNELLAPRWMNKFVSSLSYNIIRALVSVFK